MTPNAKPPLILVVEDDPSSLLLATVAPERDGFAVDGAGSAEEARELISRHQPQLILMDIRLPGMDGLEFTRELKSNPLTASIPVIGATPPGEQGRGIRSSTERGDPPGAAPRVSPGHIDFLHAA